jgi:hypothetical protein
MIEHVGPGVVWKGSRIRDRRHRISGIVQADGTVRRKWYRDVRWRLKWTLHDLKVWL